VNVREKLGFDKILEILKKYLNPIGQTLLDQVHFSTDIEYINRELSQTSEFVEILHNHDFPSDYYKDLRQALEKIRISDTYLEPEQLLDLWLSLETIRDIKKFFAQKELSAKFPTLRQLAKDIKVYQYVFDRIKQTIDRKGQIPDSASKELKQIRQQLLSKRAELADVVHTIFKQAQKQGIVEPEANPVIRGGKLLIPVIASKKNRIQGIVRDTSATGKTVYIEPLRAVELTNEIIELELAERREIIRILTKLADDLRPYLDDLITDYDILAKFDFIRAKAQLAIELDAEKPMLTDKPMLDLHNARHPLLILNFKASGRKVVPLSIKLDDEQRIVLISGPNAGGKTVALKTVGLLQYMLQTGFLIPARFSSTIGIFDQIFVDIGDDQSIENDLSTYSSHLLNIKHILEHATERSLVLIDEFGSGTDPAFGGAIAEAVLEKFLEKKLKAVITTHYSNLKHFAAQNQGIVNAAMLFDSKNLKPLYILELGRPGSSFALEIAQSIGLPKEIIERAKQKIGKSQVNFDQILREIEQQRQQLSEQNKQIAELKKQLREKVISYRTEYERILREKKKIINQANLEADRILAQANKLIENTIRQIKEKKAEKQATKKIRQQFENQRKQLNQYRQNLQQQIEKQLEENLRKQNKLPAQDNRPISVGDFVKHKRSDIRGQVVEIKDNNALVLVGNLKSFFKLNELEKLPPDQADELKRLQKKGGVKVEMTKPPQFVAALDVRGMRADEALNKVLKFLDAAWVAGTNEIRILHGTGEGILRKNIRALLQKTDYVEWFGDADPRFGGAGVTIVKIKR